jgi:hypothetical protein
VTTPAHAAGAVSVTVTNPDTQSATLANGFAYGTSSTTPISFIQVASATPQSTPASVTVAYPSVQTAGDLNVVVVGINNATSTVQSVQDSAGNVYTRAIGPTLGTGLQQSIYYAPNIVGGSNSVTVTFTAPAPYPDIRILQYRGVSAVDVTAGASGSGTSSNSGAATTSATNALIFGANMVSSWTTAAGTGFTSRIITPIDSDIAEDRIVAAAGSYTATASIASGAWVMQMVVFKPVTSPAPTVAAVAPASGSTLGGTAITITGSNFVAGATVKIGGIAATNVVFNGASSISATAPPHAAGAVAVVVTNPDAQSGTLANGFTYVSTAPTVASVAPVSGTTLGGTVLTLTGTNFVAGATVSVGGTPATSVTVNSATAITATTPAHAAGAVTVAVTNPDTQSGALANGFTYISTAPTIAGITPASGPTIGGTSVTIAGTNFVAGATVTIGGAAATNVVVLGSTSLTATTPPHDGGAVSVTVTNPDQQSGTLGSAFTYLLPAPTATAVSPLSGTTIGGTAVTISGSNFAAGATVTIGGLPASNVVVVNGTSITATTPAHAAGSVNVTVTNPDSQAATLTNGFTYVSTAPTISSVAPGSGSTLGGTVIAVSGTNFVTGATVSVGGTPATNVVFVNGSSITATTPAHAAGLVTVTVTNPDAQSGALAGGFTFISTAPTITSVTPAAGPTTGGTAITITGSNFVAASTVAIGGTPPTDVVVVDSTSITATTPAHAGGVVGVTVTNPDAQSGTLAGGFTYLLPVPSITAITPASGTTIGGTPVTITGANFAAGATVTIGGASAGNVVVVDSASITATAPAHAAGAVNVTVTNPDAQSATLIGAFTYVSTAPTIASVTPASGTTLGGTAITIGGTNFMTGASVTIGGATAANVVVVSSTSLTATTPAHAAGVVNVSVRNPDAQTGTLTNGFAYISTAPTVASVTPASGSTLGGTAVTIAGTNFAAGATVSFGGTAAANVVVVDNTSITATTPAHAAGAVAVTVTNLDTQSGTRANGFTYVSTAPTIAALSPTSGLTTGGTAVTITGTNFVAGATVTFGGTAGANVVVVSATSITVTTPAHAAGAVAVTVTNPDSQSATLANGFVYGTATTPISFVQVASATPQSTLASVTVAYPSVQTAGDLNVVVVGINNATSTVQSVQDSAGNVYTRAIGPTLGTALQQSIYYAPNVVGGSNSVTVTFTAPAPYPDIRILQYRGVTTVDVTAGASGSSNTSSSGAATTTATRALVFGANMVAKITRAAGTGFTARIITPIDSDIAEDRIVAAAGTYTATASITTGAWVMQMVIFK